MRMSKKIKEKPGFVKKGDSTINPKNLKIKKTPPEEILKMFKPSQSSSNISEMGFLASKSKMRIKFIKGGLYEYHPVTQEQFDAFLGAPSLGVYLHEHFRNNSEITSRKLD